MWIVSLVCLPLFSLFSVFSCFGVFCCCFRGYIKISMAFDFFICLSFLCLSCSYLFKIKHDNRSFVCCFTSSSGTNVRRVYCKCTRLAVGKEVCRSFGRRKYVAGHRNCRLVLSLRSRYRQKMKNRLPPYFGFTASAKVVTAQKQKTAYRRKITAVWHYRPACVRLKKRYRR